MLRIGRAAAYRAVHRGEIPTIRIGRALRVPRAALDHLLDPLHDNTPAGNGGAVEDRRGGDDRVQV